MDAGHRSATTAGRRCPSAQSQAAIANNLRREGLELRFGSRDDPRQPLRELGRILQRREGELGGEAAVGAGADLDLNP